MTLLVLALSSCAAVAPPVSTAPVASPRTVVTAPLPKVKPAQSDLAKTPRSVAHAEPQEVSVDEVKVIPVSDSAPQVAALPDLAEPPRPAADPATLVGLDQDQTRRLLGMPASTEDVPPAKVWHYAKGECALKVFFFLDMTSSQDFRALSYDLTSSENVPDIDSRCFAQLIARAGDVQSER